MKNLRLASFFLLVMKGFCLASAVSSATAGTIGDFTYVDNGATITITDYDSEGSSSVSIPSNINGKPVTSIGENAFYYSDITSVNIPSTITNIGPTAFYGCEYLHRITLPNSIVIIGDAAFSESGLNSLTIPSSVTTIGNNAFSGCENLKSFTIPSSVTTIGNSAFNDCWDLTSVTIASTALLDGTFIGCWSLKSARFLGIAPATLNNPFDGTNDAFRVYYYDGMKGFTWPSWQGYPTSPIGAEITVQQPAGSSLLDGKTKKNFGSLAVSRRKTKLFTIINIGTENLTGFSISKHGLHAKDFIVRKPKESTLAPGKKTTFKVIFKPISKRKSEATIHIKCNDVNENPFDITLKGRGVK